MFHRLREDIRSVFERDPAARNTFEVLTTYPGLQAVWVHRAAHGLWRIRLRWLARVLANVARLLTGLENHPGHHIAKRQMQSFGGMLSFEVRDAETALEIVGNCRVFKRATSLGGTESLIEHRASIEENSTTPPGLIRVSAGIEHTADLLDDLRNALSMID